MTDEFLRTHPNFKANLPSLYMTPTSNKFRFPQDRSFDHFVAYASKNLPQLAYWQNNRIRFFQFHFNLLKPTHHDLNTNPNDITTTPSVKKLHHQTYQLSLEQKHPQNFIFQNHKFTSPFSYHSHYSLNHLFTIGTIRKYNPVKQYFFSLPIMILLVRYLFLKKHLMSMMLFYFLRTFPTLFKISFQK